MRRLLFATIYVLSSCGYERGVYDDGFDDVITEQNTGELSVALQGRPRVSWNAQNGKTTIVVQFVARNGVGQPLAINDIGVEMLIDKKLLDPESVLQQDSIDLESNIFYTLVLDASYSMLEHTPPAFAPMLQAARNSVDTLHTLWRSQPGTMDFEALWFEEKLYRQADAWRSSDILTIPAPSAGTATKLYGAVEYMAMHMREIHADGVANAERDTHVMVVFTDGADNYSFFDNSGPTNTASTSNGARYEQFGWGSTSLNQTVTAIRNHPNLRVHVIGLGNAVESDALRTVAQAGNGLFLQNPDATEIDSLFERVTQEFTTVQTQGATVPLPPGEYRFTLRVHAGQHAKDLNFRFRTGALDAQVIN